MAVSSRALFDLVEERRIYEEQGVEKYVEYQQENENVTLKPGPAFHFVKVRGSGAPWMLRGRMSGRGGAGSPPCAKITPALYPPQLCWVQAQSPSF